MPSHVTCCMAQATWTMVKVWVEGRHIDSLLDCVAVSCRRASEHRFDSGNVERSWPIYSSKDARGTGHASSSVSMSHGSRIRPGNAFAHKGCLAGRRPASSSSSSNQGMILLGLWPRFDFPHAHEVCACRQAASEPPRDPPSVQQEALNSFQGKRPGDDGHVEQGDTETGRRGKNGRSGLQLHLPGPQEHATLACLTATSRHVRPCRWAAGCSATGCNDPMNPLCRTSMLLLACAVPCRVPWQSGCCRMPLPLAAGSTWQSQGSLSLLALCLLARPAGMRQCRGRSGALSRSRPWQASTWRQMYA